MGAKLIPHVHIVKKTTFFKNGDETTIFASFIDLSVTPPKNATMALILKSHITQQIIKIFHPDLVGGSMRNGLLTSSSIYVKYIKIHLKLHFQGGATRALISPEVYILNMSAQIKFDNFYFLNG